YLFFFFSSRRRHTRFDCDWSSDVCSSDLHRFLPAHTAGALTLLLLHGTGGDENDLLELGRALDGQAALLSPRGQVRERGANRWRSEERRVGKECRSGRSQ